MKSARVAQSGSAGGQGSRTAEPEGVLEARSARVPRTYPQAPDPRHPPPESALADAPPSCLPTALRFPPQDGCDVSPLG